MNAAQTKAALWALLPIAIGLSVLGLFVVTDNTMLLSFGVLMLWFGLVSTTAAGILVVVGHLRARRDGVSRGRRWGVSVGIASLVIANYPIAAVCASSGLAWATRYTVQLDNGSRTPWHVELHGPGVDEALTVVAGERAIRRLWFRGDGSLSLRADGQEVVVEGYVTHNLGGAAMVVRDAGGTMRLLPRRN